MRVGFQFKTGLVVAWCVRCSYGFLCEIGVCRVFFCVKCCQCGIRHRDRWPEGYCVKRSQCERGEGCQLLIFACGTAWCIHLVLMRFTATGALRRLGTSTLCFYWNVGGFKPQLVNQFLEVLSCSCTIVKCIGLWDICQQFCVWRLIMCYDCFAYGFSVFCACCFPPPVSQVIRTVSVLISNPRL